MLSVSSRLRSVLSVIADAANAALNNSIVLVGLLSGLLGASNLVTIGAESALKELFGFTIASGRPPRVSMCNS